VFLCFIGKWLCAEIRARKGIAYSCSAPKEVLIVAFSSSNLGTQPLAVVGVALVLQFGVKHKNRYISVNFHHIDKRVGALESA